MDSMYSPVLYIGMAASWLFWPIVIGTIIYLVARKKKKDQPVSNQKRSSSQMNLEISTSKEDAVSQFFFLLAFLLFGVTLFAIDRAIGDMVPWNWIVLFSSLIGLFGAYTLNSLLVLPFAIGSFISWWVYELVKVTQAKSVKGTVLFAILAMVPVLLYVLGHFHAQQKKYLQFSALYKVVGIIFTTMTLFLLSTQSGVEMMGSLTLGSMITSSWQLIASLATIVVLTIGFGRYSLHLKRLNIYEYFVVIILTCLFVGMAFLPPQNVYDHTFTNTGTSAVIYTGQGGQLTSLGIFWVILFNLGIFLELLGLIFSGYMRREEWLINVGALFLFLLIVAKYFDWFFTFLDKSIFFIGAGILLFALGWFMERGRRYMIANVHADVTPKL